MMFSSLINLTDYLTVNANMDTEAENKLTEEELLSQMLYAARFDRYSGCSPNDHHQHDSLRRT